MEDPVQRVFDIPELRHKILTEVVRDKYKSEVRHGVQELVHELITMKWFLYCSCDACSARAIDYYTGV